MNYNKYKTMSTVFTTIQLTNWCTIMYDAEITKDQLAPVAMDQF